MSEVRDRQRVVFSGKGLSKGIFVGKIVYVKLSADKEVPEFAIPLADVEQEIERYKAAIRTSRTELNELQLDLANEGSNEAVSIIDTHIQMLEDPFMTTFMEKRVRKTMKNMGAVFSSVMGDYEKKFEDMENEHFKERSIDVKDLKDRILRKLYPETHRSPPKSLEKVIIISHDLIPSFIADSSNNIGGVLTLTGTQVSHCVLVAKSKKIPLVANIDVSMIKQYHGSLALIDGDKGELIINPSSTDLKRFKGEGKIELESGKENLQEVKAGEHKRAKTQDGVVCSVYGNIRSHMDISLIDNFGGDGVGLFRTEFLLLEKKIGDFSPELQLQEYLAVLEKHPQGEVVFRLFDVGGDKGDVTHFRKEINPALGLRGIRFLLANPDILVGQLKALMMASRKRELKILLPMVSDVSEIVQTKSVIKEVALGLKSKGEVMPTNILVGSMLEVPSAVWTRESILELVDFVSIGTNDLIQYFFAIGRESEQDYAFFQPTHPAFLEIIRDIAVSANKAGKPVVLCGEMAANPLYVPLLLGLGIRKFSCSPREIPVIKGIINRVNLKEVEEHAQAFLSCINPEEIERGLREKYLNLALEAERNKLVIQEEA
ncbi:phosphoenolpyruvate--protein phosphotransferase [Candidatus Aerophobetes bacterium]|uniref:Phosphoenolpyruvate-protein phosphotransferase n=1 Tax=Aerophobetes bacterium TaxID=2030807 RepID=A0A2A4X635_UNCAE|nr:MAG: phosphoenolpyruvate--protein phosphotransferase [Candidatus Aerophobetes bacterium]